MKATKKLTGLLSFLLMISSFGVANAQLHMSGTVSNNHLWRGMEVGDGLVLSTDLSVSDKNQYIRAGFWGGTNVTGSYKEFDYYVTLSYNRLSLSIWDIYNFSPGATYNNREFFNYKKGETGRFIDATLSYTISEKVPLLLSWSTVLYGRDRDAMNKKNLYSTFAYAEYPVYKNEKWTVTPGLGAAFALSPAKDAAGNKIKNNFYGESAGIVHISLATTYNLTIKNYAMPITAKALFNPKSNKGYFQIAAQVFSF